MENLEIIKNMAIIISTMIVSVGLILLYTSIIIAVRKISKVNNEIEKSKDILEKKSVDNIKADSEIYLRSKTKKENQEIATLNNQILKLEREKEYILEKVSIYKLFKK